MPLMLSLLSLHHLLSKISSIAHKMQLEVLEFKIINNFFRHQDKDPSVAENGCYQNCLVWARVCLGFRKTLMESQHFKIL